MAKKRAKQNSRLKSRGPKKRKLESKKRLISPRLKSKKSIRKPIKRSQKKIRSKPKKTIKRKIKTIKRRPKNSKRVSVTRYYLNYHFQYIDELKDLVLKSSPEEKEKIIENLLKLGRVKLAIATGIFLNRVNSEAIATDLFIVGDDISRRKLRSFLKSLEADVGKEVRYVIMEKEEFQYRIGMFDRFIRVLLEGPHEKLINRLGI